MLQVAESGELGSYLAGGAPLPQAQPVLPYHKRAAVYRSFWFDLACFGVLMLLLFAALFL